MNLRWTWGSGPAGLSTDPFPMLVMGLTGAEWTGGAGGAGGEESALGNVGTDNAEIG